MEGGVINSVDVVEYVTKALTPTTVIRLTWWILLHRIAHTNFIRSGQLSKKKNYIFIFSRSCFSSFSLAVLFYLSVTM